MLAEQNVSLFLAFGAGLLSFVSPCVLPLIPSYVTYITGLSLERLKNRGEEGHRLEAFLHSLAVVAGFTLVFVSLGAAASLIGQVMANHLTLLRRLGGLIVIIFGLHFMEIINIRFLQVYKKAELREKPAGYIGSMIIGVVFAAGWAPCIGPILASILIYASASETMPKGLMLLCAYSLGLGIPFVISAVAINHFFVFFQGAVRYRKAIAMVSGMLLIVIGLLIITNSLTVISAYLNSWLTFP